MVVVQFESVPSTTSPPSVMVKDSINTSCLQEMNSRTTNLNNRRRRNTSLNSRRFDDSQVLSKRSQITCDEFAFSLCTVEKATTARARSILRTVIFGIDVDKRGKALRAKREVLCCLVRCDCNDAIVMMRLLHSSLEARGGM
jgi:hypothetical protein